MSEPSEIEHMSTGDNICIAVGAFILILVCLAAGAMTIDAERYGTGGVGLGTVVAAMVGGTLMIFGKLGGRRG